MKRLISICILVLFAFSLQAQEKKPLTQDQLSIDFGKAKAMKTSGIILTIVGYTTFITGGVLFVTSPVDGEIEWGNGITSKTHDWRGGGIMLTGLGLTSVGIPLWIVGGIKKRHINNALVRINFTASVNGVGLKVKF
jgi:hypothetical protein